MDEKENKELEIEKTEIEIGSVNFTFTITRDEAEMVIKKPRSQVARNLKKYMVSILTTACQKFIDTPKEETVKNCKLDVPKG